VIPVIRARGMGEGILRDQRAGAGEWAGPTLARLATLHKLRR
jgi:hypothetical protein